MPVAVLGAMVALQSVLHTRRCGTWRPETPPLTTPRRSDDYRTNRTGERSPDPPQSLRVAIPRLEFSHSTVAIPFTSSLLGDMRSTCEAGVVCRDKGGGTLGFALTTSMTALDAAGLVFLIL